MSPANRESFEQSLVQFYTGNPPDDTRGYADWTGRLVAQGLVDGGRRQRRLGEEQRELQEGHLFAQEENRSSTSLEMEFTTPRFS